MTTKTKDAKKEEKSKTKCVICDADSIDPDDETPLCRKHLKQKRRLSSVAEDRFQYRRILRGTDFEHYVLDHERFGIFCGEFTVLRESDGDITTLLCLDSDHDWAKPAFKMEGLPECPTLAQVAVDKIVESFLYCWNPTHVSVEVSIASKHGLFTMNSRD